MAEVATARPGAGAAAASRGGGGAAGPPEPPGGLGEEAVAELVSRLEGALALLEETPGRTAETALDAVAALTEVYGEGLARVMRHVPAESAQARALAADRLVGHLLALHGVHPLPVEQRVQRALDEVRPYLRSHGGEVELAALEGDVAYVRLSGGCETCASAAQTLRLAVEEAVLAAVPDLTRVERADQGEPADRSEGGTKGPGHPAAFIPADALLRSVRSARTARGSRRDGAAGAP